MIAYFANWGTQIHMADTFNRWVSTIHYNHCRTDLTKTSILIGRPYFTPPHVCRHHPAPHLLPAGVPPFLHQTGQTRESPRGPLQAPWPTRPPPIRPERDLRNGRRLPGRDGGHARHGLEGSIQGDPGHQTQRVPSIPHQPGSEHGLLVRWLRYYGVRA